MSNPDDQGLVRKAMRRWPKRWRGLTDEFKDELAGSLRLANEVAARGLTSDDPELALKAVAAVTGAVRTGIAMEAQVQADEHLAAKEERLDAGDPTENVQVVRVLRPPIMRKD
jgi:hypothetical protein